MSHSSTFAGGALASRVALKTLEMLTRNDQKAIRGAKDMGNYLIEKLKAVQQRTPMYSKILKDVRGRGLMIGIEFTKVRSVFEPQGTSVRCLMGAMAEQGLLVREKEKEKERKKDKKKKEH